MDNNNPLNNPAFFRECIASIEKSNLVLFLIADSRLPQYYVS